MFIDAWSGSGSSVGQRLENRSKGVLGLHCWLGIFAHESFFTGLRPAESQAKALPREEMGQESWRVRRSSPHWRAL